MDFEWLPEQTAFRERVAAFAESELNTGLAERDRDAVFPRDLWRRCAEFGILGLPVPREYGGAETTGFTTAILAMEGLGRGCRDNGLTFALNAQMWTVQLPIVHFGSEPQKERLLPALCAGEVIGAHAITEPETGSDVFAMTARAERVDGGYVLNGVKHYVSLAPVADLALVFATVDPSLGKWGITGFVVDCHSAGVSRGEVQDKMGLRTVPMGRLEFIDCFVPESDRLGPEGAGVSLSNSFLEWERCAILASHLGAMERQLDECVTYARERRQFDRPIGKFQSVSHRIADMKLRLETSRLLLYKVAWLKEQGRSAMIEAAMLKLHLSESFAASSLDAIRVHGGRGYLTESGVERDLRDSVGGVLYAGTSDIQRNIIAALLGL